MANLQISVEHFFVYSKFVIAASSKMEPELLVLVTPENCSKLIGKRVILILPEDEAEEVKEDLKKNQGSTTMGIEIEAPTSERVEESHGEAN